MFSWGVRLERTLRSFFVGGGCGVLVKGQSLVSTYENQQKKKYRESNIKYRLR